MFNKMIAQQTAKKEKLLDTQHDDHSLPGDQEVLKVTTII